MVQEPVKHCSHCSGVAKQTTLIFDGAVRGKERAGALVTPHEELKQIFAGGRGEFTHADVVDDEAVGPWPGWSDALSSPPQARNAQRRQTGKPRHRDPIVRD